MENQPPDGLPVTEKEDNFRKKSEEDEKKLKFLWKLFDNCGIIVVVTKAVLYSGFSDFKKKQLSLSVRAEGYCK